MGWDTATLTDQLSELRDVLTGLPRTITVTDSEETDLRIKELAEQIDDYLIPRLANMDAPLLAAIGGSTGSGKSTLVNSLARKTVSEAGLLRPTTRQPVLVCNPESEQWFRDGGILAHLPRTSGNGSTSGAGLQIVTSPGLNSRLAILDTPDIDSVETANHQLARQLLSAADLWLFMTTASRYADAVPWGYLAIARDRGVAVAVVINRIPAGAEEPIAEHFAQMLDDNGLEGIPVFLVPEVTLNDGHIPVTDLLRVQGWLYGVAAAAAEGPELAQSTLHGALRSIPHRLAQIAEGIEAETVAARLLTDVVTNNYKHANKTIEQRVADGSMLRQQVLTEWQEYVGSSQIMRSLQGGIARIRDAMRSIVRGQPTATSEVQGELTSSLRAAVLDAADNAADDTVEIWERTTAGRLLLGGAGTKLSRPSETLRDEADSQIKAWQDHVLGLVRQQAEDKHLSARLLSLGINTIGVSLMVVIFAQTGGITGGEMAVAGGTATVSQALLTALFGENAVRDLARQAYDDLTTRVGAMFEREAQRFLDLLAVLPDTEHVERLHSLGASIREAIE